MTYVELIGIMDRYKHDLGKFNALSVLALLVLICSSVLRYQLQSG